MDALVVARTRKWTLLALEIARTRKIMVWAWMPQYWHTFAY